MDKNRYLQLPTTDNLRKPKFMGILDAVLEHMVALGTTGESIGSAFDVNNAAGKQLDVIGELVGLSRLLPYNPTSGTREMNDDEYRLALQLTIARNEWDGTNGGAVEMIREYLSENMTMSYIDNQDESVTYTATGDLPTRAFEILNAVDILFVPSGVSSTMTIQGGDVDIGIYTGAAASSSYIYEKVKMI